MSTIDGGHYQPRIPPVRAAAADGYDVVAIDVRELAFGSGIPAGIDGIIPIERHWEQGSSLAPLYEAT